MTELTLQERAPSDRMSMRMLCKGWMISVSSSLSCESTLDALTHDSGLEFTHPDDAVPKTKTRNKVGSSMHL